MWSGSESADATPAHREADHGRSATTSTPRVGEGPLAVALSMPAVADDVTPIMPSQFTMVLENHGGDLSKVHHNHQFAFAPFLLFGL